ncbi:DUF368 domain-containing protein [Aerococcaceae bacterium NML130460]|nr:DUF368 domain-containing protein [Aerococcaceae bacterium NML171108]MCW6680516.1 DUF368 domain-containing protein [Aerococcaceae bacterium NML130460]MDO4774844.1 DUF368 domain-containing protein [Aerococcaceae bacterium]
MKGKQTQSRHSVLYRFIVGMFIGSGFILPGVSGGALAAIFGIYERIISFLANLTKQFKENVLYFIPVALGAGFGIFLLSFGVSYLLTNYQTIVSWFFVGCIVGAAPALWQEAGKKGRTRQDIFVLIGSFVLGFILLEFGQQLFNGSVQPSFLAWIISGCFIALGMLIPGLSPSNFILYMGLYDKMSDGFKSVDFSVILPIAIGGVLTILLFSKLVEWIFKHYYSLFFHFIFGIVIASTLMIIPRSYPNFALFQYLMCVVMLVAGIAMGLWMAKLEAKYK